MADQGTPGIGARADVTERDFVVFDSPGTFFDETSERPIDGWDVKAALALSKEIVERYNARPFCFHFEKRLVAAPIDDGRGGKLAVQPRTVQRSGRYYIDGRVLTQRQVDAFHGKDSILAGNMRANGWAYVVETGNGYRHVSPFDAGDMIVSSKTGAVSRPAPAPQASPESEVKNG